MKHILALISLLALLAFPVLPMSCGEGGEGSGEIYCCTYQSRATGCGGTGWKDWKDGSDQFNIDDYLEGWTPERVCNKYTGSDTECGGSCCINVEYRNNTLSSGTCSGG